MTSEVTPLTVWTFVAPCPVPEDISDMLIEGEHPHCAFKTVKDVAIFTNKRLIVRDSPDMSRKKIEAYTLPYRSIEMYSTENAGKLLDFTSEIALWTSAGYIRINLNKNIDIHKVDTLIANCILNA